MLEPRSPCCLVCLGLEVVAFSQKLLAGCCLAECAEGSWLCYRIMLVTISSLQLPQIFHLTIRGRCLWVQSVVLFDTARRAWQTSSFVYLLHGLAILFLSLCKLSFPIVETNLLDTSWSDDLNCSGRPDWPILHIALSLYEWLRNGHLWLVDYATRVVSLSHQRRSGQKVGSKASWCSLFHLSKLLSYLGGVETRSTVGRLGFFVLLVDELRVT